ncbi:uncharacterized protein TM35_000162410 [Trypanosoma theileri]|uniref:Uncharacterized protein n=1 Tax=Trypanosoma theileri TaxID=67003 RepID=A0A1X0NVV5_9TRYP|nr:uncharacterized protein TM35_000162410 [Trypanosoma theileri]ORC88603.1 hypothetical protein TM35_000162410 [Trypanosoma theileri]
MSHSVDVVPLPEALRRIIHMDDCSSSKPEEIQEKGENTEGQEDELSVPLTVSQLLDLVHAIKQEYMQLVANVAKASVNNDTTFSLSNVQEQLKTMAGPIAALQRGIRSKNAQCVRIELRAYLANEVESRRRALSRMGAALSIAKQSV